MDIYLQCEGIDTPNMCSIDNIPIQKWVNLMISVYSRTMDIYLDGKLVNSYILPGTYTLSSGIIIPDGIYIHGISVQTTILQMNVDISTNMITMCEKCRLEGLTVNLYGNNDNIKRNCI